MGPQEWRRYLLDILVGQANKHFHISNHWVLGKQLIFIRGSENLYFRFWDHWNQSLIWNICCILFLTKWKTWMEWQYLTLQLAHLGRTSGHLLLKIRKGLGCLRFSEILLWSKPVKFVSGSTVFTTNSPVQEMRAFGLFIWHLDIIAALPKVRAIQELF